MILKGSQRRGAIDLALHLYNEIDNEMVVLHSIRGAVANDLYGAFREWEIICDTGTKAKNCFYSLSINPDPQQRDLTDKEWLQSIEHIEKRLGLTGQPRAVVFHEKVGTLGQLDEVRKHCHVVWSRTKLENGKLRAVHIGNDYYKLKSCVKELTKKLGLELHFEQKQSKQKVANFDHAKSHGKNRDGETVKQRKSLLTELWEQTDSAASFCAAASNAGYIVAQGQRRAFVVVDEDMQIHAFARQIEGVRTKHVKARLGDTSLYPNVEQAKEEQRMRKEQETKKRQQRTDLTREQKLFAKLKRMAKRADAVHMRRHKEIDQLKHKTATLHVKQIDDLVQKQRKDEADVMRLRQMKQPKGLVKIVCDKLGITKIINWLDKQEDIKRKQIFSDEVSKLKAYHFADQKRIERKSKLYAQQEKREAQSIDQIARKLSLTKNQAAHITERPDHKHVRKTSMRYG